MISDSNVCDSSSQATEDESTFARDKFGGQKAISSDMYFERNAYDPVAQTEARERLQQFQGATAISSNAYFGRPEDDAEGEAVPGSFSDGGLLGDGSLAGLENAARDALQRVMSNPDVQNVGESLRAGALKVQSRFVIFALPSHPILFIDSFRIILRRCLIGDRMSMGSDGHYH